MKNCCILACILAAAFRISAAPPKIAGAAVDPNNRQRLIINFDNPFPAAAAVDQKTFWLVYEKTVNASKATSTAQLHVDSVDTSNLATQGELDLSLVEQIPGKPSIKEVDIILANTTDFIVLPALTTPQDLATNTSGVTVPLAAASDRSHSDVYFNGSYAAVVGGSPTYNIDTFAGYMWALPAVPNKIVEWLGFYGQATTKMSPTADPNSFQVYGNYEFVLGKGGFWGNGHFQAPIFNYRFLGTEFDKSANELNITTSPTVTIPFRPVKPPENMQGKVTQWPQFNLIMGTEFVGVEKSVLAPTGAWHTRGLFGANGQIGYAPKKKGFDSILLTSSWQVRLPSAPEIFYDDKFAPIDPTTGIKNTKKTPPMLGTQPRHYLDTKVTFNYVPWAGITFEHTYGSLPPAFNKTDQTFTVGLTLSLQQTSYGRTSILRP